MKLPTVLALALAAAAMSLGCNQTASSQPASSANASSNQTTALPQQKEAARISLADAKAAFDTGKAVFIDTRDIDTYNAGHIKGAIQMSAGEVENRYKELPADKQIIAYCS